MHQVLGVMIFSSLLFVSVKDLVPVIIRFGISATTAQYIRVFEISGLLASPGQTTEGHFPSFDRANGSEVTPTESKVKNFPKAGWMHAIVPPPLPLIVSSIVSPSPHNRIWEKPRANANGTSMAVSTEKGKEANPNTRRSSAYGFILHEI